MRVVSYLSLAVIAATVLSIAPQRLHAQGAQVEQTGGSLSAFGGFYVGTCNNVKTPSGNITVTCHLKLQSGTPVSQLSTLGYIGGDIFGPPLTCVAIFTPAGTAGAFCQN